MNNSDWIRIREWTNQFPEEEKLLLGWILRKAVMQEGVEDPLKVSFNAEEAFALFGWENSEESLEKLNKLILSISKKSIWLGDMSFEE